MKLRLLVNQYVTETLLAPTACAAQLNMIDNQTIFIKMWMDFFKLYGYSF